MEIDKGSETESGKFEGVVEIPKDNYALIYSGGPPEGKVEQFCVERMELTSNRNVKVCLKPLCL